MIGGLTLFEVLAKTAFRTFARNLGCLTANCRDLTTGADDEFRLPTLWELRQTSFK